MQEYCNFNSDLDEIQAESEMICPECELNDQLGRRTEFDTEFYPTLLRTKKILKDFHIDMCGSQCKY